MNQLSISPNIAIVIILIIIALVIFITLMVSPTSFREGRMSVFFATLAGFTIFVLFFFWYLLVVVNSKQQQLLINQETNQISGVMLATINNNMKSVAKIDPAFILSINPLMPCCATDVSETPEVDTSVCLAKSSLAYDIFVVWKTTLTSDDFSSDGALAYITKYLQFANSQELFGYWLVNKINFNSQTQIFGDLLFEYALPIRKQKPHVYVNVAKRLIADSKFRQLLYT